MATQELFSSPWIDIVRCGQLLRPLDLRGSKANTRCAGRFANTGFRRGVGLLRFVRSAFAAAPRPRRKSARIITVRVTSPRLGYGGGVSSRSTRSASCWLVDRGYCDRRSEEHTSELQSLMRISYAVFCLKKKKIKNEK